MNGLKVEPPQPLALKPSKRLAGQFEILKCRVDTLLNGKTKGPVALAFTSCRSHEGVSAVAANFAATLVGERRVLLMDGDLRRPGLRKLFPRTELKALESASPSVKGAEMMRRGYGFGFGTRHLARDGENKVLDAAWHVARAGKNLDVLLARRALMDPGQSFDAREFSAFLDHAKQHYDTIILDCPPILENSSAVTLASKTDGVVMVVEAGRVRREVVQRAVDLIDDTGGHVLGVVLNKRRYPIPRLFYRML